ncbi:glycoside hydrolase family 31 protein [Mucilaginibacter gynuensis]|uniref:Glycoside hydrolase family 31 protein n=2 Tax=Mucilaginibacter gynuensis TaxID=1302236 RepID=A0ABP8GIB5_9SPHI
MGNVTNAVVDGGQVKITTQNARAEVTVYTPSVIRVRIDKHELAADFSYAVIAKPQQTKANITQNDNEISIVTDSLKLTITKKPFAVTFYTPAGEVINQDETGLATSWVNDAVTTYKKMQPDEHFVGLGEKTGPLDRKGAGFTNWNSDTFGYRDGQDPIYSTIPFYIGIHHNVSYGIFMDNTYQSDFNFGASNNRFSSFGAHGGEMNYYFIYHKHLADIITSYTALTGRMHLPPLWSLGYQQNRYSYYPDTEVYRIAQTLREKKIPADGITLDIHYMDKYKVFTWDKQRFPDPAKMTGRLKEMGFKTTLIVDPGVKAEPGYGVYDRGLKDDIFIKYQDNTNYTGEVWPGWCHFPDFTGAKGRNWWETELKQYAAEGVSGIWNDMNEIATWGQKMPDNVIFDFEGRKASHLEARNVYGLNMIRASYEGYRKALNNKRPFILTRSGYAGLQRYSAIWTGDNRAEDDHMLLGVRLLSSLGLSGVAFSGMDIGGFTGNASVGLYTRWVQIGAFNPYFRNHTGVNTKSAEPWAFGEEALEIARNYINLRYKLLPYLYSTFYEATQNGQPVVRSLAINYTHDPKIFTYQNEYQFGNAFLIAPFASTDVYGTVYLPKGKWYDLYSDELSMGNKETIIKLAKHKLPVYVKESSIIPMQSLIQNTTEKPTDTLDVHIYKGDVNNSFVYYEDDGESYDYENGSFYKRTISYKAISKTITFGKAEGSVTSKFKYVRVLLHGFETNAAVKADGKQAAAKASFVSFIAPISRFDPEGTANPVEGSNVKTLVLPNGSGQFTITY